MRRMSTPEKSTFPERGGFPLKAVEKIYGIPNIFLSFAIQVLNHPRLIGSQQ
jgi:hypothetical protein